MSERAPAHATQPPLASAHGRPWRKQLVLDYMPLARRIARGYESAQHQEDLEQVAYMGLAKAAERFDPRRGTGFSSYAIPTIHGEIKNYLRDHSWAVHVPRLLQERSLQAQRIRNQLVLELGREPTVEEVARRLGVDAEIAAAAMCAASARDARSLDAPREDDEHNAAPLAVLDTAGAEDDRLERVLDRVALRSVLACLSDEERQAIGLRYLADLTQREIAARLGASQMHVSRVLRRAVERLSDGSRAESDERVAHGSTGEADEPAPVRGPQISSR